MELPVHVESWPERVELRVVVADDQREIVRFPFDAQFGGLAVEVADCSYEESAERVCALLASDQALLRSVLHDEIDDMITPVLAPASLARQRLLVEHFANYGIPEVTLRLARVRQLSEMLMRLPVEQLWELSCDSYDVLVLDRAPGSSRAQRTPQSEAMRPADAAPASADANAVRMFEISVNPDLSECSLLSLLAWTLGMQTAFRQSGVHFQLLELVDTALAVNS